MAADENSADAPPPKKKSKKLLFIIGGAVALLQGAGLFLYFKMSGGGPAEAQAGHGPVIAPPPAPEAHLTEVELLKSFRVPNDKTGRMQIFDIDISVVVPEDKHEAFTKLTEQRAAEVADRVSRVLRGATPDMMREDDLQLLREQLKHTLDELTGDPEMIVRILIPHFLPIPT